VFNDDPAAFLPVAFTIIANGTEGDDFIKALPAMVG
jgi:hypothetical protein